MSQQDKPSEPEEQGIVDRLNVRPRMPEDKAEEIRKEAGLSSDRPSQPGDADSEPRGGKRDGE